MSQGKTLIEVFTGETQEPDTPASPAGLLLRAVDALCQDADLLKGRVATYALELEDRDRIIRLLQEDNTLLRTERDQAYADRNMCKRRIEVLTRELEEAEVAR